MVGNFLLLSSSLWSVSPNGFNPIVSSLGDDYVSENRLQKAKRTAG